MKKRIAWYVTLAIWTIFLFKWSNTSNLQVIDPSTWLNSGIKNSANHLSMLIDLSSEFYLGYFYRFGPLEIGLNFYAHKLAHILGYTMLGYIAYKSFESKRKRRILYPICYVMVIATFDEIHQLLTFGRSGRMMDVVLDTVSAIILLLIVKQRKGK